MANGLFGGGDGSSSSPYLIEDAHDLNAIRNFSQNSTVYLKLANDIDMNVAPYNEGAGWAPISQFSGRANITLDGNNHAIKNLYINRPGESNVGLFSNFYGTINISNIAFINVNITGYDYVGTIASNIYSYGSNFNNILISGSIKSNRCVGGVAYYITAISDNYNHINYIVVLADIYSNSIDSGYIFYSSSYSYSISSYYAARINYCIVNSLNGHSNASRLSGGYTYNLSYNYYNTANNLSLSGAQGIADKDFYNTNSFSGISFNDSSALTIHPKYGPVPSFMYKKYYFFKSNDVFYKYNISTQEFTEVDFSNLSNGMTLSEVNSVPLDKFKAFVQENGNTELIRAMHTMFDGDYEQPVIVELWCTEERDKEKVAPDLIIKRMLIPDDYQLNNTPTKSIDITYSDLAKENEMNLSVNYDTEKEVTKYTKNLVVLYKETSVKENPSINADIKYYEITDLQENNGHFGDIMDDIIMIHNAPLKESDDVNLTVNHESYDEHDEKNHVKYIVAAKSDVVNVVDPKIKANIQYNSVTENTDDYLGYFDGIDDVEIFQQNVKNTEINISVNYETEKPAEKIKMPYIEAYNKENKEVESITDVTAVYSKNSYYDVIRKYAQISAKSGNYSRYLVSIDNGTNWLKFDTETNEWITISISNILSEGMTKTEMANNNMWQYLDTSYKSQIKFAIGINSESSTNFSVQKITISFDENTAPIISDDEVSLDDYFVYLNGRIYDIENDKLKYQIFTRPTNETEDSSQITEADWKQIYPVTDGGYVNTTSDYTFDHKFELNKFKTGKNIIKIVIQDQRELVTEKEYTVEINAGYPRISINSYNDFSFDGIFEHTENRDVKARIFINDKQFSPRRGYSNWLKVPYKLHFEWSSDDVIYGMPNTIKIELIDDLGNTETMSFIIEGAYKNLLFRDRNNVYYSTDKGEILEQLDLGKIIGGEIADSYEVFLENHTGMDLENVTVFIDPSQMDEHIKIQVSETGANNDFVSADSFTYKGIMKHNDTKVFYVRAEADNLIKAVQDKVYNIYAKGDPVLD